MRKESLRILFVEMVLVFIISFEFMMTKKFYLLSYVVFLLIPVCLGYCLLGTSKRSGRNEKDVFLIFLLYGLSYYFVTYVLGYFTGFERTVYSTSVFGIFLNVVSNLLFFSLMELLRWMVVSKCQYNSKWLLVLFVLFSALAELVTKYTFSTIHSREDVLSCFLAFLPILSKNILLSYVVYYTSIINVLAYRLIMDIPIYFLPIFPDFGNYLNSVFMFLYPLFLLSEIQKVLFLPKRMVTRETLFKRKCKYILEGCLLGLSMIFILLVSGCFRFYALTIGSNSMANKIQIGDIVILDRKKEAYQVGDIIAYQYQGRIVVHRIYTILNDSYQTKGDNNSMIDDWIVHDKDIVGIVRFKIPWLGLPTVKLNQWIMDGE